MYMPSIFGESLFDNMFPFDEKFFTEKKDPLYGKNVSRLMKTDVRETATTIIEMISRTVLIQEMTIKTVPTLIEMTEMMLLTEMI